MMISSKGRYALRVMIDLAEHADEGYIPLQTIAARQGISEKYLESILAVLSKARLLDAVRGKGGGYRLSRPAKDYTAFEILSLTEGTLAPVTCLESGQQCENAETAGRFRCGRGSTGRLPHTSAATRWRIWHGWKSHCSTPNFEAPAAKKGPRPGFWPGEVGVVGFDCGACRGLGYEVRSHWISCIYKIAPAEGKVCRTLSRRNFFRVRPHFLQSGIFTDKIALVLEGSGWNLTLEFTTLP